MPCASNAGTLQLPWCILATWCSEGPLSRDFHISRGLADNHFMSFDLTGAACMQSWNHSRLAISELSCPGPGPGRMQLPKSHFPDRDPVQSGSLGVNPSLAPPQHQPKLQHAEQPTPDAASAASLHDILLQHVRQGHVFPMQGALDILIQVRPASAG